MKQIVSVESTVWMEPVLRREVTKKTANRGEKKQGCKGAAFKNRVQRCTPSESRMKQMTRVESTVWMEAV